MSFKLSFGMNLAKKYKGINFKVSFQGELSDELKYKLLKLMNLWMSSGMYFTMNFEVN